MLACPQFHGKTVTFTWSSSVSRILLYANVQTESMNLLLVGWQLRPPDTF